jgi:hypothetical protein
MPTFTYCGTIPRAYQESRDEDGVIIGTVSYGDTRDLAAPLDADWFPAGAELPVRLPPEPEEAAEAPSGDSGTSEEADSGKAATPAAGTGGKPQSGPGGESGASSGSSPPAASTPAAGTTPAGDGQKAG